MKVALAQLNTTVGDIAGNCVRMLQAYRHAAESEAEIVVFPELAITGYPPRDLLLRRSFVDANLRALERLTEAAGRAGMLIGYVGWNPDRPGRELQNCAALLQDGHILATRAKSLLPTYDVFDEARYFQAGRKNSPVEFNGKLIGLTICEDIWNDKELGERVGYETAPAEDLAAAGAEIIFNLSASPWQVAKHTVRLELLKRLVKRVRRPLVYCNLVGGNDELVFDGASMVLNARGDLVASGALFEDDIVMVDTESTEAVGFPAVSDEEKVYRALVLGVRDYLFKCGFRSAVLGLSGGIDSAVTAVLAAEALGPDNVRGVSLPSKYSSKGSLDDARALAGRLRIGYDVIPIEAPFQSVRAELRNVFQGVPEDTTEENLQARLRGVILMALSNKFGSMLLTTGNKSEIAVGYCTLYGDMCGGLAVISDLPKTLVYRLARWINRSREIIPRSSIAKPPSAELRPNQTDQDTLPPYDVLDTILEAYVHDGRTPQEIVDGGQDDSVVRRVVQMIDRSEYKRRQAAPGLRVTSKAFGMGRRIPVAQRYSEG